MGREFNELFDQWSHSYDNTVSGKDPEYEEVFLHYDEILSKVADSSMGTVVEFGVGTGNLTNKLMKRRLTVFGMEPSEGMRKIAQEKLPDVRIFDGDFLNFPNVSESIDTFVSTYAFHHLTDKEKEIAIGKYSKLLKEGGRVVFADTVFATEEAKRGMIQDAKGKGYNRLAEDLEREYYTTISVLQDLFNQNSFSVTFTKLNPFVWLIDAKKIK
ncbi:class I SAM-dependent DNA methyltransferase [Heyndrickxia sp. NPDC080065]|uniref:class I SAM-dependent DNA methyltransferase n=1 Tax=Heyndrickxia sp. NPDC080065 TaxID=3390568 RepID=UPI003D08BDDB